ncbi:4-alpha-glucanotransferase [Phyllobacterium ifriqiyense]|uniref:4-alpha-glucanotransferase n=1 Tax=Phyllobacterium ifriqiyense TaxID=314238 RepID=A0ABU0S362_9HYPH|nr:4-alpha-glucanotransferase [Phyllobacterium ifriqiyense]MDQ0995208.1 4-alpha-glucanotransferase [Phyllobacterium ifriqiyense]
MKKPEESAAALGISMRYEGTDKAVHEVPWETVEKLAHELNAFESQTEAALHDGSVNNQCYMPEWLDGGRSWGLSLQLYELRSRRNWGIGDFADLAAVVKTAGGLGADFIGLNPLHALFMADPDRNSPFSPSNRRFLNPIYIAVDHAPGYQPAADELEQAAELRRGELVEYLRVAELKLKALRRCWHTWLMDSSDAAKQEQLALDAFRREAGQGLFYHALFECLSAEMKCAGLGAGWQSWPEAFRDPQSDKVAEYAVTSTGEIDFHCWLQWVSHKQLNMAADAARTAGLRLGLYLDFAVGEVPDGSSAWSSGKDYLRSFRIGAPPDFFSTNGQDWGLAPFSPQSMVRPDSSFRKVLDQLMSQAGALRIDHAMALKQLFLVPDGSSPSNGTYLRYPFDTLVQIVSCLSRLHKCIVIGEDLGNVPRGFREAMTRANVLSYRVLYFEKTDRAFTPMAHYPKLSLACLSTHDLPTLAGWWLAKDIELRCRFQLIDETMAADQHAVRLKERHALLLALAEENAISQQEYDSLSRNCAEASMPLPLEVMIGAHRFLARSPSLLTSVRLADVACQLEPTNMPGTAPDVYPNWRRKLSLEIEELGQNMYFQSILAAVAAERPR